MQAVFVYVTCKDRGEAMQVGRAVVEARLAACANVIGGMESVYWWEGKLESAKEAVLILKTQAALLDALTEKVKEQHSYTIPCVVAMPVVGGNEAYLEWIFQETGG
ncbi:MAG TPA: divalent-cation tolerance protein CutA [Bacteroidia bacterium]|nr:divalent-cation tolerance protein CutA [Bacteroidia bacterium]